jgi:hypothetical protein
MKQPTIDADAMTARACLGLALAILVIWAGGAGNLLMSEPEGWQTITVGKILSFRVPLGAKARDVRPIDSLVGIIDGDRFEITYDYGRFSERVEAHRDRPGYSVSTRPIGFRKAQEVSFRDTEDNPALPFVQLLRVEDGANALTLRVSCADESTCSIADAIFDSVEFN